MANASAGEPLVLRHGVALYSAQTTYGTPVTPATSCGACMVGVRLPSNNVSVFGPGSATRLAVRGGSVRAEWTMRWEHAQTGIKTLLQKIGRTSGVAPLLTLGFGYSDDEGTPNRSAYQIQDCKVDRLSIRWDKSSGNAPVAVEMSGIGGLVTALTTLAPATLSTTPWMVADAYLTRAASAYPVRSFEVEVTNNLSPDAVIPGSAPASYHRGHSYLTEHNINVRGRMVRYGLPAVTVQGQTLSTAAMVLAMTNPDDAVAFTTTLASVDYSEEEFNLEKELLWNIPYEATSVAFS